MVTMDADFLVFAAEGVPHAGIAYCRQETRTIGEMIAALTLIFDVLDAAEMSGAVEYI